MAPARLVPQMASLGTESRTSNACANADLVTPRTRGRAVRVMGKMMGLTQGHLKKLKERRGQLKKLATDRELD